MCVFNFLLQKRTSVVDFGSPRSATSAFIELLLLNALLVLFQRVIRCCAFAAFTHDEFEQSEQHTDDDETRNDEERKDVQHQV